jgi:hypothetical protein
MCPIRGLQAYVDSRTCHKSKTDSFQLVHNSFVSTLLVSDDDLQGPIPMMLEIGGSFFRPGRIRTD